MSFIRHHQTKEVDREREEHHHHHLTPLYTLIRSIIDPATRNLKSKKKFFALFGSVESERILSRDEKKIFFSPRRMNLSFPRRRVDDGLLPTDKQET
jgi:hypothetical protein